jgi:transposase-like protein
MFVVCYRILEAGLKKGKSMIPSNSCEACGESTRMTRVGFVMLQGYLCEACNTYNRKDGYLRRVIEIKERDKNMLFENQLVFAKAEKKKRGRNKTPKPL